MIGGLGTTELVIILVIVLVIFGAGKLPEVGGAMGKGIRNFRRASRGEEDQDVTPENSKSAAAQLDDHSEGSAESSVDSSKARESV